MRLAIVAFPLEVTRNVRRRRRRQSMQANPKTLWASPKTLWAAQRPYGPAQRPYGPAQRPYGPALPAPTLALSLSKDTDSNCERYIFVSRFRPHPRSFKFAEAEIHLEIWKWKFGEVKFAAPDFGPSDALRKERDEVELHDGKGLKKGNRGPNTYSYRMDLKSVSCGALFIRESKMGVFEYVRFHSEDADVLFIYLYAASGREEGDKRRSAREGLAQCVVSTGRARGDSPDAGEKRVRVPTSFQRRSPAMDRRRNWKQPRTPHETLGLGSDACLDQVKTAYKRLALRYHPDKNTDKFESTKKFREINSAYKELTKKLQKADAAEKKVLGEASEAAFRRYDAQMSSLVGADLIDERDLIAGERKYRQEAMNLFSRTKSRWPQLLQKLKDEFEKRLQARYEEFRKARDSRQIAAENNMRDAIKSAVGQYDTQMNRLCQGDLISHQDLAKKEEEYRRQAIAAFVKQGSQWPFLLKKFEDELKRSLEDQHELYRKRRNEKEAEAEMQLRRTLESAVTRYDDRMTRLGQGHLVSLQELAMKHEDYRKEALETLLEVGVHCPHISQKFEDELEKRLQARHTFHQEARNARETRGKTELRQALESAASRHRIQLRRLFEEDLISEEDMETRDAEYRRQAIATFFIHGSQWPLLSEKFEDELEKRLHADYAIFAKERDAREAAVRLHLKSEMESSIDRYDVQMTLLRDGELISKQEMRMSAAKYRRQARLQAVYETYEKQRNSRQTEVETQLWKEVASTAGRYDDQMSRLCEGDLISEQELVTKEAEFRSLAIATFFKSGLQWPFLLKKFANHLKLRLKMRYEICMKKRAERKREATLLLRNAVASAVIQYENQMNRLCEGDLITELELRRRHENYRGEALKAIFSIGAHCPQISRKFENELEKRLRLRLAVYEEQRNAREAIERHAAIQLKHALSSAAAGYDIQMSRWIEGPLVDEEELRARDAECRRGALAVFSKQASQWPHLSKKFEDELEEEAESGHQTSKMIGKGERIL
ncbi:unnamed protein product [Darwinula stevensoni]|uniref:J domain-containing protein n=1 Tax=Darwinula stevensoni TaxID=69355 RepID=A0A7R8XCN8_9CRUS|nr:unnamed protein product [Darwinula stevensoni]CAG0893928.1 unnamed protein product [Darwinula stevensoni]